MGYTVKYNHPHFPEGTEFNVGNLGRVPNGGSLEIDEDMERTFLMTNGVTIEDTFKGDAMVELSGSSSLDKSEVDQILAFFAPTEEELTSMSGEPAASGTMFNTPDEGTQQQNEPITPEFLKGGDENA